MIFFSIAASFILISCSAATAGLPATSGGAAAGDTVIVKKKRVKKDPSRIKTSSRDSSSRHDEPKEKTSFFGSCLGSILESICSSMLSGDKETKSDSRIGAALDALSGESSVESAHQHGYVEPADIDKADLKLWNTPGGFKADGYVVRNLERGRQIDVISRRTYDNVSWLLISSNEPGSTNGWVEEKDLMLLAEPDAAQHAQEKQKPAEKHNDPVTPKEIFGAAVSLSQSIDRPKFLLTGLSYPLFRNSLISEEYIKNTFRVGAEFGLFVTESISIDLSIGYLYSIGIPQYDYVVSDIIDSPLESRLRIRNYGIQFGQSFTLNNIMFFRYGIAPTLFDVREDAWIREYDNGVHVGGRAEELAAYKVGGELKVATGFIIARNFPVGICVRYCFIPWRADEEKSLTLDYLDANNISLFSFGISVGCYLF